MPARISFIRRILDLFIPRHCAICGHRLGITDHSICMVCNWQLPRTNFCKTPKDNDMAKLFWLLIPIENAAALFFYYAHSNSTNVILNFKYKGKWNYAENMGRITAYEFTEYGFFDDIDAIVPVPITRKRERERGYNQSYHIALGVKAITGLPIIKNAIKRVTFAGSQTQKSSLERKENVKKAFKLVNGEKVRGKHILIIDDVVTTGSTITSCAEELMKAGAVAFSVLSIGFTKH